MQTTTPTIDYFSKHKFLLNLLGSFPSRQPSANRWCAVGRRIYAKIVLLVPLHICALFCVRCVADMQHGGMADILFSVLQVLVFFHMSWVTWFYQNYADALDELLGSVNECVRRRSANGLTYVDIEEHQAWIDKCIYPFTFAVQCSVLQYLITPIQSNERVLILQCWYPFDPLQSPYYELIMLIQTLCQMEVGLAFTMNFIIISTIARTLCCQLNVLCCSIKNVLLTAMLSSGCSEKYEKLRNDAKRLDDFLSKFTYCVERMDDDVVIEDNIVKDFANSTDAEELDRAAHRSLNACINHMQAIYKVSRKVEDFFYIILLMKIAVALVQIGLTLANVLWIEHTASEKFNDMQYLAYILLDSFMLNYCGQIFLNESSKINSVLYNLDWHERGLRFQTHIQMFMLFTLHPIPLRAGKFFVTSYELFVQMLRMSFSFFTLLSQANEQ